MSIDADVVLFAKLHFHLSCLTPIYDQLIAKGINAELTTKRHMIYDSYDARKKKFKVMVISDEYFSLFRDCAEILIGTGHSLVSKNTTFSPKNAEADYLCTISYWQTKIFKERIVIPKKDFWETGYVPLDRIFNRELPPGIVGFKNIQGATDILIAPTYNQDLSLIDDFIANIPLFDGFIDYNIVLKPHPVLPKKYPGQMEVIKALANKHQNFTYIEDSHADVAPYIQWCDIFIGDCSGALFYALAADKPIIAYSHPHRERSPYYDAWGPEWIYRPEYAYQINTFAEVPGYISEIKTGDILQTYRSNFKERMFENFLDGRSAERIADKIITLL